MLADYLAYVRAFSPNARFFLAAATLGGLNAGVASVLLNLYVLALGYDERFLGRFVSYGQLAALPAALLAGPLIDRWGAKRAMLAGTALVGGGAVALLLSRSAAVVLCGQALQNMGAVVVYIAVPPFLVRNSRPHERAHLFAVVAAAYVASNAAGKLLGGYLPGIVGGVVAGAPQAQVYRLALFAGAVASAAGLPLLLMVRESWRADRADSQASPASRTGRASIAVQAAAALGTVSQLAKEPAILALIARFVVADAFIRLGGNLVVPYFNVFFIKHLGAAETWFGTLSFLDRCLVVVATLAVAPLAKRFGPVATVVVTQVLSVPVLIVMGFAPGLGVASAALLCRGSLMEMTVPVRDNFLMDVVPDAARATANATLLVVGYAIGAAGARIGGRLLAAEQFGTACIATGALYVVSAALYWWFFRRVPQASPGYTLNLAAVAS
jgi:MFS family permease